MTQPIFTVRRYGGTGVHQFRGGMERHETIVRPEVRELEKHGPVKIIAREGKILKEPEIIDAN